MWRGLDKTWERPDGWARVLATSPDGKQLAAQWGAHEGAGHAAVWDCDTKKIVWRPEEATAIGWVGGEILVTRLDRAARHEVVDWYDAASRQRLGTAPVVYPIGSWLTHGPTIVGCEPAGLAAIVWLDQSEGGVEILRRGPDGWSQVKGWGHVDGSNRVEEAVFSGDARFLALPYGNPREGWWEHTRDGTADCGMVVLIDLTDGARGFIDLRAHIAEGWEPDPGRSPAPFIRAFPGAERIEIELQTAEVVAQPVDRATFKAR